jgi:cytochrome c oxidase subunit 2
MWVNVDEHKTGTYRGQCAELCGRDHGFMPIVVEVKSKEDFAAWLSKQEEAAKQAASPETPAAEPVAVNEPAAAPIAINTMAQTE